MKNIGVLTGLALVLALLLGAQPVTQKRWTALTATGTTAAFPVGGNDMHTVNSIVTGGPAACTIHLDGSVDGTNWFDLSGDQTCTSSTMFHVVNRSVILVRANLTALSGGTAPTVTVTYIGQRTGGRQ